MESHRQRMKTSHIPWSGISALVCLCLSLLLVSPAEAQQIQVTAADPPAAEQGTVNLNVSVKGKGFKRGAVASFVLTGTDNPDGIAVNATTFVSSTELTANITVAETATVSKFDIKVRNSDGRIGKGTELFAVLAKGSGQGNTCTTLGTPAGWTVVDALNRTNADGTAEFVSQGFGVQVRARPADLDGNGTVDVIVVMVSSGVGATVFNFQLDPVTGQRLSGGVVLPTGAGHLEAGEVNGDGIPDFAVGNKTPFVLLSGVTGGQLTYTTKQINPPTDVPVPGLFGNPVALGDLDGDGRDELAVGARGGIHGSKVPGTVYVYRWESGDFVRKLVLTDPLPNQQRTDYFSTGLAIGDVTGDSFADIIAGAYNSPVDGVANAGRVFVFPGPALAAGFDPSNYAILALPGAPEFGYQVGVGNVDGLGMADVVATTHWTLGNEQAAVFSGPVSNGQTPTYRLVPSPGITNTGWATGFDVVDVGPADGRADVLVGAPNSTNGTFCNNSVGTGYLYLSAPGWSMTAGNQATAVFQPPVLEPDFMGLGYSMAGVPGYPFILIGENGANPSGQVWVYKRLP